MLFAQPITLHRILRRRSGFDIRLDDEMDDVSDGGPETARSLGCFARSRALSLAKAFSIGLKSGYWADGSEGWRLPIGSSRALSASCGSQREPVAGA
jgi:hypothetical protein